MKARLMLFAGVALALAFLLPNHYPPWASFQAEAMAALALAPLAMWAGRQNRRLIALSGGALVLSFAPLIQLAFGQISFAGDAWMAWLYISGFGLAIQCGATLIDPYVEPHRRFDAIVPIQVGLLAASLISTVLAANQWLHLGYTSYLVVESGLGSRPFANLAQPNQLASLLLLGLAAVVFLYEAGRIRARYAIVASLILVVGLAMTQSRTPILGGILVCLAALKMRRQAGLRTTFSALGAVTACYALLMWVWPNLEGFLMLVQESTLGDRMQSDLRLTLWRSMLDALVLHPWVGWGWGQISIAQQAIALNYPALRWWFESSHNLFLDLALWGGIPLAVLVIVGISMWTLRAIRNCRDPFTWSLLLGVGFVFCHSMVEYPLMYAYFLLPIGLFMGAISAAVPANSSSPIVRVQPIARVAVLTLGLIAIAAYAKVVTEYWNLEREWRDLRLSRSLVGAEIPQPPTGTLLLTQLQARADFLRVEIKPDMDRSQLDWMGRLAQRYGTANFMLPYAKALALNKRLQEANRVMATMCKTQAPSACKSAQTEWAAFQSNLPTGSFKPAAAP